MMRVLAAIGAAVVRGSIMENSTRQVSSCLPLEQVIAGAVSELERLGYSRRSLNRYCAYSTRWRTRFHADGGQRSSVIADTVPR